MKKLLSLLFCIMLIFAFAACGGNHTAELDQTLSVSSAETADADSPVDEDEINADEEDVDEDIASDSDIEYNYNYEVSASDSNLTTENYSAPGINTNTPSGTSSSVSSAGDTTGYVAPSTDTNGVDNVNNANGTTSTTVTVTNPASSDSDLSGIFIVKYHANTASFNSGVDVDSTVTGIPTDNTQYTSSDNQAYIMGNNTVSSVIAHYNTMIDGTPTWSGHTFGGWATTASTTVAQYQPGSTLTITGNMDLYAVWTVEATETVSTPTTTTTPQTGENDFLFLYVILAFFALIGMVYLLNDQRKAGRRN